MEIFNQNKKYMLYKEHSKIFIAKKDTFENYERKYNSIAYINDTKRNLVKLKTIFNVSKILKNSNFNIVKNKLKYEIRMGLYEIQILKNDKFEFIDFSSIKETINFIKKIENGKIKYKIF